MSVLREAICRAGQVPEPRTSGLEVTHGVGDPQVVTEEDVWDEDVIKSALPLEHEDQGSPLPKRPPHTHTQTEQM